MVFHNSTMMLWPLQLVSKKRPTARTTPFRSLVTFCALSTTCRSFSVVPPLLSTSSTATTRPRRLLGGTINTPPLTTTSSTTSRPMTTTSSTTNPLPSISKKIQGTLDPCVVLMKELVGQYTEQWQDKGGIFSLAQGVVYWKPPASAAEAMKRAIDDNVNDESNMLHLYGPDEGLPDLRQRLEQKIAEENGLHDHHIMVTTGANQAYMNCVLTLLQDKDKAVVFAPFYFNHVMAIQMTIDESGLLVGPSSDTGLPDLDWLETQFKAQQQQQQQQLQANDEDSSAIRAVTIVNPGNPTGTLLERDFLQKAVDLCRTYKAWLILDSTYEYFVPDSNFDGCFADPHVLHIFSFSKAYALAGYRCGYVAIPKKAGDLYDQMMKVQDTIPISPPRISQIAALGSMEAGKDWVRERINSLETGRQAILEALSSLEQVMGGSGAMYVMGKLPEGTDDQEFGRKLVRDYGVAVIPGSFCGFPGWIRVCYSNLPPEKCKEAAERLKAGLQSLVAT